MAKTKKKKRKEIIKDIKGRMAKCGGDIDDWYVGIAAKPKKRLFDDHSVDKDSGAWIWRRASSDRVARKIEKYFLDQGAQGGTGGGDEDTTAVYAYKITSNTQQ